MSVWDKLWKGDRLSYTHYSTQEYEDYIEWIKQVKAEGDKLEEKAAIYDAHEWITKETPEGETLEIYHIEQLASATDKIKTVEIELRRVQTSSSLLGRRYNISAARFHEFVTNLWKAIGEQDPRVQCEGCPDKCVEYTEFPSICPHEKEAET